MAHVFAYFFELAGSPYLSPYKCSCSEPLVAYYLEHFPLSKVSLVFIWVSAFCMGDLHILRRAFIIDFFPFRKNANSFRSWGGQAALVQFYWCWNWLHFHYLRQVLQASVQSANRKITDDEKDGTYKISERHQFEPKKKFCLHFQNIPWLSANYNQKTT